MIKVMMNNSNHMVHLGKSILNPLFFSVSDMRTNFKCSFGESGTDLYGRFYGVSFIDPDSQKNTRL